MPQTETPLTRALAIDLLRTSLEEHAWIRLRVSGECMAPALRAGDLVRLVSAAKQKPRWGDIVLIESGEGLRLHRLVWSAPFFSLTKADRSVSFDRIRSREAILASVVEFEGTEYSGGSGRGRRFRTLQSLASGLTAWAGLRAARALGVEW
jgi:hypothetical protein